MSFCSSSVPEMTEYATKSFIKRNLSYKSNLNRTWSIVICTYHFKKSYNASTSGILTWGLHWMQRLLLTISLPATLPSDPRQQTQETSVISHTGTAHIDACQLPKNKTSRANRCKEALTQKTHFLKTCMWKFPDLGEINQCCCPLIS